MQATAVLPSVSTRTVAYSRLGDESLARRAADGNQAAFTALYERYYGPLLGYCRSILLDPEDARDATQSALENALRALPRREPGRPVKPWLYRIAHNESINIVRRRQPQAELDPECALIAPGPEVDAEARGRLSQLVSDLRELPERQRGALVMRELSGLSYDEIAAALGVSNEAARRAVFDARSALHDAVDGRATACVSVRHKLSDGDRRSLRARSIRAHLRSCDDCASFQRAIGIRQNDLHLIGWLPGATGLGILGSIGAAGGAGSAGGALIVASGGSAIAGGGIGIGWATLPVAVKGLAVAAAVATTGGAAAVELRHVSKDSTSAPKAQVVQQAPARRAAPALASPNTLASSAATLRAATRQATRAHALSISRVRSSAPTHNAALLSSPGPADANAQTITPPAAAGSRQADTTAQTSHPSPQQPAAAAPAKTAAQIAIDKLTALRDQIRKAYELARATAAAGTPTAIQAAGTTLSKTLGSIQPLVERVLATVGLSLPSNSTATATQPPAGPASPSLLSSVFKPVEQVVGGLNSLLQSLFARQP